MPLCHLPSRPTTASPSTRQTPSPPPAGGPTVLPPGWGGVSTGPYAQLNLGITRPDERAAVRENYHRFCAAIGVDETRLVMTHQVHEDGIRVATAADVLPDLLDPIDYRVDGLVTNTPGLPSPSTTPTASPSSSTTRWGRPLPPFTPAGGGPAGIAPRQWRR